VGLVAKAEPDERDRPELLHVSTPREWWGRPLRASWWPAIGEGWCFFANGASYIAVIAGLLLMRVARHEPAAQQGSPLSRMRKGSAS